MIKCLRQNLLMLNLSLSDWQKKKNDYFPLFSSSKELNLYSIEHNIISDGEGYNTVIYFQGCPRFCLGCRNIYQRELYPASLLEIDEVVSVVNNHPVYSSRYYSLDLLLRKKWMMYLLNNLFNMRRTILHQSPLEAYSMYNFLSAFNRKHALVGIISNSKGERLGKKSRDDRYFAVSICGGEPFAQVEGLLSLVTSLKQSYNYELWLYTGYKYEDLIQHPLAKEVLQQIDFLKDQPYQKELRNYCHPYYGSVNQRIIDIKRTLVEGRIIHWTPRYDWSMSFIDYWRVYKDVDNVHQFSGFDDNDEVDFFMNASNSDLRKINTVYKYEKIFGNIEEKFKRILI